MALLKPFLPKAFITSHFLVEYLFSQKYLVKPQKQHEQDNMHIITTLGWGWEERMHSEGEDTVIDTTGKCKLFSCRYWMQHVK